MNTDQKILIVNISIMIFRSVLFLKMILQVTIIQGH